MEKQPDHNEIIQSLHKLFSKAFQINAEIDKEDITEEEKATLKDLNPIEVIENLKDLLTELLNEKRKYKNSDADEFATANKQFEAMIQKLESEVRNHIRTEQQLKLHAENIQARLDAQESGRTFSDSGSDNEGIKDKPRNYLKELQAQIRDKDQKISDLTNGNEKVKEQLKHQHEKLIKLELELESCKKHLSNKVDDYDRLQAKVETLTSRPSTRQKQRSSSIREMEPDSMAYRRKKSQSDNKDKFDPLISIKKSRASPALRKDDVMTRKLKTDAFGISPVGKVRKRTVHARAKTSMRFYKCSNI